MLAFCPCHARMHDLLFALERFGRRGDDFCLSLPSMFSMGWATVELFALDSMIVIFTL